MRTLVLILFLLNVACLTEVLAAARPNILIAISDDQSFAHTSAAGYRAVKTPAFDRVALEGVLFRNAFAPSPGCSPTRASFLTGRHTWQIEQAGTHASEFPTQHVVFPDLLEESGYFVGFTGKGWGPGNWRISGRLRNPAGLAFNRRKLAPPHPGISGNDYAGNFSDFLSARPPGTPFCFWYGASEPHRTFARGSGIQKGKKRADAVVPSFLPDTPEIRSDLLDYCVEIEWFDTHLGRILDQLRDAGELDNTLIIVTSDNGMSFPRAKANLYEFGIHVPLAIRWGARVPGDRVVEDLIGFVDLTATLLDAAEVAHPEEHLLSGRSILSILTSTREGTVDPSRDAVYAARERHSSSRYDNLGYPQRCIRTRDYLYIRNFKPERWPAGAPQKFGENGELEPMHDAYHDIDACPSLTYLVENRQDPAIERYFHLAVDKRPAEELFDIRKDPGCLINLALDPDHIALKNSLRDRLMGYLKANGDARAEGGGDIWETYERYSPIRTFPKPGP